MPVLWTSSSPRYQGQFVAFEDVVFGPKPHGARPVIWIGGDSEAAMRRTARFGDGWLPWQISLDALPAKLARMRALFAAEGRTDDPRVSMPLARLRVDADHRPVEGDGRPQLTQDVSEVLDLIARMAAGVTQVQVPTPSVNSFNQYLDWLERFGGDVVQVAKRIT
jgi:hypothetical protein